MQICFPAGLHVLCRLSYENSKSEMLDNIEKVISWKFGVEKYGELLCGVRIKDPCLFVGTQNEK